MNKNKRNFSKSQEESVSLSKYIDLINLIKEHKKIIKVKSNLDNNKKPLISLKKSLTTNSLDLKIVSNDKNNYQNIIFTYNYIINKLNELIKTLNEFNYEYIYSRLIKIKEYINKITTNKIIIKTNINKNKSETEKYNSCNTRYTMNCLNETSSEYIKEKKIKYLKQKNANLENKIKTEKYKYLICIGEQNKKIKKLEEELNKLNIVNISQNESKKYICFPNYKKFDILDKYTQSKDNSNKLDNKKKYKKYILEQNKDLSESEIDTIDNYEKSINKNEIKGFDKEGNYLISHPKLKYVKDDLNMKTWKINELLDNLPKSLMRHKFSSKLQKNNLIVFPSSLNQIMVNLEKLRIHNFKSIENHFKDNKNIKNK